MASVDFSKCDDVFAVGATVGVYPGGSFASGLPTAPSIATGVVSAAGRLTIADAGIVADRRYVLYLAGRRPVQVFAGT